VNTTNALVISQIILSFGIPFALVPLILLTRKREVMGEMVNRVRTSYIMWVVVAVITVLNVDLIITSV
jgi:manganese transport protein